MKFYYICLSATFMQYHVTQGIPMAEALIPVQVRLSSEQAALLDRIAERATQQMAGTRAASRPEALKWLLILYGPRLLEEVEPRALERLEKDVADAVARRDDHRLKMEFLRPMMEANPTMTVAEAVAILRAQAEAKDSPPAPASLDDDGYAQPRGQTMPDAASARGRAPTLSDPDARGTGNEGRSSPGNDTEKEKKDQERERKRLNSAAYRARKKAAQAAG
jgi:hypothetical protein